LLCFAKILLNYPKANCWTMFGWDSTFESSLEASERISKDSLLQGYLIVSGDYFLCLLARLLTV